MDSGRYQRLEEEVLVNPLDVESININTADIDELKKHPYIRYNMAKAIVNYRISMAYSNQSMNYPRFTLSNPKRSKSEALLEAE